jgi:hypothetical protein
MVNQALFGELYRIVDSEGSWKKIRLSFDDYEGWLDTLQIHPLAEAEYLRLFHSATAITLDLVQLLSNETRHTLMPVVMGSSLPGFEGSRFRAGEDLFYFDGQTSGNLQHEKAEKPSGPAEIRESLLKNANLYRNAPYQWGGRSPFGIDCSGFVQMVYKLQGIPLLRDASRQANQGEIVSLLAEACPGDLAFFDDHDGNIVHVGLLLDTQRIIHCSGSVRIDAIDHEGIFDAVRQKYTHQLRLIKRII